MPILIKKKVSLDFLGDDYKDGFVIFKSIPLKDYDDMRSKIETAEENNASVMFLLEILKNYFLEGKLSENEDFKQEDLEDLDLPTVLKIFTVLTGQTNDPKVEVPSTMPSITMPDGQ